MSKPLLLFFQNSGSPKCKEYVITVLNSNKNCVRISKADFREMIHPSLRWLKERDKFVVQQYNKLVELFMNERKDIIIDDLNSNPKNRDWYESLCEKNDYQFRNVMVEEKHKGLCVFQFEGGLVQVLKEGWVIDQTVEELLDHDLRLGCDIIIVSGHMEHKRGEIEQFLNKNNILYSRLIMRPCNSVLLSDASYKLSLLEKDLPKENIYCFYDFDEDSLAWLRECGVHCVDLTKALCL